ncbi:unnamed protein product [Calypogeia fissa]
MATILTAGTQEFASVVVTACRSRHSLQQQQRSPMNVICSSSSQLCRQGAFSGRFVTNVGYLQTGNHSQVSYFLKSKQKLRLRATARAELLAGLAEDTTETVTVPDVLSSPGVITNDFVDTTDVPTQIEGGSVFEQGVPDVEPSSPLTSGDVPPASPSVEVDPNLLDGADSSPSTSLPAVDALQSSGEDGSVDKAAMSAQEEYLRLTGGDKQGVEQIQTDDFGDSLKAAQDSIGDSVKAVQDSIGDSVKAAQDSIGDSVKAAQDSIGDSLKVATDSVDAVVNAVRGSVDSAGSSVKNAYDSLNESIVRVIKPVTAPFEKSVDDLQSKVDNATQGVAVDFTGVFLQGTPANNVLKEAVSVVKSATGSAVGAAGSFITQAYSTAKDNVPPEVQSFLDSAEAKVAQITGPVGSAIDQAYIIITDAERAVGLDPDNPVIPVILVVGGSLFLGFSFFRILYGGYSGDLLPSAALDILKNENAVLVDIRSQATREDDGIPDLRRSTRSKFAEVEIVKVEGAVRGMIKNTSDVESLITAAVIRNLKSVNGGSKIIVLDTDGSRSKQIARGLKKSGAKRAYRVDGGFKAWVSSGLRVKAEGSQSALAILQEEAEALVEEVQPTTSGIVFVLLGSVAGVYALYEWERTLQLIGLLGVATSIYFRVSSYETVEDAQADLKLLQKPFTLLIQAIVWIGGLIEPKKLQLATSPVSSNVQGRVIQAAAKHGPNPSELELVQEEPREEPDEIPAAEQEDGEGESTQTQHTSVQDPE